MALFGGRDRRSGSRSAAKPSRGRLPADMPQWLEALARFEWDPQNKPAPEVRVDKMYLLAQADREGFLAELAALTVPAGGWVALGGKYLATDVLPIETDTADFNAIVLAAYQFLRQNGVPPNRLSPNDHKLWSRVKTGDEPWLIWREPPPDTLTPLQPGELRQVAQTLRADGHINDILVRQDDPNKFTAVVEGAYSETDLGRTQTDWYTAPSQHDLYIRIGEGQQTPTHWAAPELEPYFPLPPMTI
jgi:hypothetical protein